MAVKGLAVVSGSSTVVHKLLEDGTVRLGLDKDANVLVSSSFNVTGSTSISGSLNVTGSTNLSASSGFSLIVSGSASFQYPIDGQVDSLENHKLSSLSNVSASSDTPIDGQLLVFDSVSGLWKEDPAVFVGSNEPTPYSGRLWLDTATTGSVQTVDPIRTITSSYTASVSDVFIMCDASSGGLQVTTYSTAGNIGRILYIKKIDSSVNTVTISGSGSPIDGQPIKIITNQYDSITMVSTANAWHIV